MTITFNPIITQGAVYWHTGLWECSYIFLVCLHVNCVTYLEIFPAGPPPDNCVFILRTVKKILITAISENSSFLAKSLGHRWRSGQSRDHTTRTSVLENRSGEGRFRKLEFNPNKLLTVKEALVQDKSFDGPKCLMCCKRVAKNKY